MIFWIVFICVCVVVEFARTKYISVFFAGGGIAGIIACSLGYAPYLQVLSCFIVSCVFMAVLRRKLLALKDKN